MSLPCLSNREARCLFLNRHLLLRSPSGSGTGRDLDTLLDALGFVQVDSVDTLARAHDLILWSRQGRYRPPALTRAVATRRTAFEHWTHDAAVIPMAFYPMWRLKRERDAARIAARWSAETRARRHAEMDRVLRYIGDHGAAGAQDVRGKDDSGGTGWWDWSPSKAALDYLWRRGDLAVCHRRGFRKYYDLAERVIPSSVRTSSLADERIVDWAMRAALDRLGFATSGELAGFFEIVTRDEARDWVRVALDRGEIIEIDVEQADGRLRRCLSTTELLATIPELDAPSGRVRILSPFDPALRDRKRAERLLGFDYRIEIFVPERDRRYGYYVFPVWQGIRAIGRIDAKRTGQTLSVRAFWSEAGAPLTKSRRTGLDAELARVAHLAGLDDIQFERDWLKETRPRGMVR